MGCGRAGSGRSMDVPGGGPRHVGRDIVDAGLRVLARPAAFRSTLLDGVDSDRRAVVRHRRFDFDLANQERQSAYGGTNRMTTLALRRWRPAALASATTVVAMIL